jgi:prolyl oligopeptidase
MIRLSMLAMAAALVATLAGCVAAPPKTTQESPAMPPVPATRAEPVSDLLHGVAVTDPYRWLEGDNSDPQRMGQVTPAVTAWTDAQNAHTRAVLDSRPGRQALEDRLRPLMEVGSVTAPTVRAGRYFYSRREGRQNQPVWYWREGVRGESRVLLDPEKLDASGLTTIAWISPSPDGRRVAYGTYTAGDEITTLRLLEVDTGDTLPTTIPNKVDGAQWLPDGSGFVYRNLKDARDPYSGQVMFHRIGTDVAEDKVLLRQFTREENEQLATTWGPGGSLSRDGKWLVLSYFTSTNSNDLWVADFERYLATGELVKQEISVGGEGWAFGQVAAGKLFVHTTQGAPNGRVDVVDLASGERRVLVAERPDAAIEEPFTGGIRLADGVLAVGYLENASSAIDLFRFDGAPLGRLQLPGIGSAALATEQDSLEAFLSFESYSFPGTIFRVDLAVPQAGLEVWERPDVPVDPSLVEVKQVWYPSKDGTKVSMFVVHRRGLELDGARPTILYGYGGFGVPLTPGYSAAILAWVEAGGVWAIANLRGGSEEGEDWHRDGMLGRKQNVFDDFHAAAEWLISTGWTSAGNLGIYGGSNGGLLVGAAMTQRPDLFNAVVCVAPLLDMIRYTTSELGPTWTVEYGDPEDAEQFGWLYGYSPYHRVVEGTDYPATMFAVFDNDTRTDPMHGRKMCAATKHATSGTRPVLLRTEGDVGHGARSLSKAVEETADTLAFFANWTGMS